MAKKLKIFAIIPARGGSKGIPKKNIKKIGGKPLIAWTIEAVQKSTLADKTIISTDSEEIAKISKKYGAEVPFLRPAYASDDKAPAIVVIQHALKWMKDNDNYEPDAIIYLQPTSPLRTASHIDEAITKFISHKNTDSLVSVIKPPHNFHPIKLMKEKNGFITPYIDNIGLKKLDRHNMPTLYARNGPAILITKTNVINKENRLYGKNILPYEMDEISSTDIDEPIDLKLAEFFLLNK